MRYSKSTFSVYIPQISEFSQIKSLRLFLPQHPF